MHDDLRRVIQDAHVRFVRVLWCDNANIIRAKAVHYSAVAHHLEHGVGISAGQMGVPVMFDGMVPDSGLAPVGEIRLVPDPSSLTFPPYAPGHARLMADMQRDGQPWTCCPRAFLRRMEEAAEAVGLRMEAAFENEFYLMRSEEDSLSPADDTPFASTLAMDASREVIDGIVDALIAQRIPVEIYHPESGPGQHEISIRHSSALHAADCQVMFRETVHALALRHNLKASFLPKLLPDRAGSGCHLHLSLWKGEENQVPEQDAPFGLSEVARSFIAGLLEHLPALMAVTTPTTNSYRRLLPHTWSGAFRCWGLDNREAAVRVPTAPGGCGPVNFELKTVDATANPYLALGAVLAAGLDGVRRSLVLPAPVDVDPGGLSEEERKKRQLERLPRNLGEALKNLRKSHVILDAMGPDLARAFTAVRNAEWLAMKGFDLEEEVEMLLERY